ncbi:hypothetical protein O6H91_21G048200 [Diphasiastrum complanatum]|uniref:Uncharacterized protein n=1 Tax=Diphasiastrum complanatum TaxID=34168 RepID=A0ACC2AK49_DIPCM|nr:hypothetical protein O6H91_21G048200 [Diphasiastrum complanatum]
MNPYRNSNIPDVDSNWANDSWDRSTALTIQYQGSHSDWDWESQMNVSQKPAAPLEVADNKPSMLYSNYTVPNSYRNHIGTLPGSHSSNYSPNSINSLSSVRNCGVVEALQGIVHSSSIHANPMSAFPGYAAANGLSTDVRSFEQRSRILGIMDVEQKTISDFVKRSSIFQTELHEALGLNLGGRTYFSAEDCSRLGKRPYISSPAVHVPNCQAEGCTADMSRAKHYYRRHKVCEHHSKASHIFANGQAQRFCQQCSRLHPVAEFDDAKRSCRKRLADHNRRRRKPQMIGSTFSKDHEDQFSRKADENEQNAVNKKKTSSPSYSLEESGSNLVTKKKHLDHETTSCFGIPDSNDSLMRMKQGAPSLLSAQASSIPSILGMTNGQLQLIKSQEAADSYKQKLQENYSPKVSSVSPIGSRSIECQIRSSAQSLSNDIPSTAPWLVQSLHSKPAFRKSFMNFQNAVPKCDDRNMLVGPSYPISECLPPSAGAVRRVELTKDLAYSQWMTHTTAEQKYKQQLGLSVTVTHSSSDEMDSGERISLLPVLQASKVQDSGHKMVTQQPNLVAVDFLQQQSGTNAEEECSLQPKQGDQSDSKLAILQALRSFESSTYNPPTTFVL